MRFQLKSGLLATADVEYGAVAGPHMVDLTLSAPLFHALIERELFNRLFEPYVEPEPESAFMRARRLQAEAIRAAGEAAAEAGEIGKRFKEMLDGFFKGEGR